MFAEHEADPDSTDETQEAIELNWKWERPRPRLFKCFKEVRRPRPKNKLDVHKTKPCFFSSSKKKVVSSN